MHCFQNFSRWSSFSLRSSVAVFGRRPRRATEVVRATENKFYFEINGLLTKPSANRPLGITPKHIAINPSLSGPLFLCGPLWSFSKETGHGEPRRLGEPQRT